MKHTSPILGLVAVALLVLCLAIQPVAATQDPGTKAVSEMLLTSELQGPATNAISPVITHVGKISWSIDGLGTSDQAGTIQVEKPAGATVKKAYLAAATTGFSHYQIKPGDIKLDGTDVVFTSEVPSAIGSFNYWSDVTSLVKPTIDAAAPGRIDFTVTEATTYGIDGEILIVVFDDPNQTTDNTIVLMFGAQKTTGDQFNIGLAEPLDLSDPNLGLDFSLGISFGWQGSNQFSQIDVNGKRLTTSAGGQDDGVAVDGALLTVGGLDDSTANPANPNGGPADNPRTDDELYSLLPFVMPGDTSITVNTLNPSNDDNILFAGLFVKSATAVVGKGIVLSPASAVNDLGEPHTLTAKVQDDAGIPVSGAVVTFTIISGPNEGLTGSAISDADGIAVFTYTSSKEGTDTIIASFVDIVNDERITVISNEAVKTWKKGTIPAPEFPTVAIPAVMLIGFILIVSAVRKN